MTCSKCNDEVYLSGLCKRHYTQLKNARKYIKKRQKIDEIKLAAGCADCGYREHACALQFDHLPGTEKLFSVGSQLLAHGWSRVLEEIAKCDVVCANCHAVRTSTRLGESLSATLVREGGSHGPIVY